MLKQRHRKEIATILRQAGQLMLSAHDDLHHLGPQQIQEKKGKANFVTHYDVAIQDQIRRALATLLPEIPFVGEEDTPAPPLDAPNASSSNTPDCFFLLDPIDGTTNFIHDYHRSSISLALIENGRSVEGWIYNPYQKELFWAARGQGATCNGKPIHVSNRRLVDGLVCFGTSPYYKEHKKDTFQLLEELFTLSHGIRRSGSAALDLCDIACGRCDLFFEYRLSPWDYGAGTIIVQEAGGLITTMDALPLSFREPCSVLAASPQSWEDFFTNIRPTVKTSLRCSH